MYSLLKSISASIKDPWNIGAGFGVVLMGMQEWFFEAYNFVYNNQVFLAGSLMFVIGAGKKAVEWFVTLEKLKQERLRTKDLKEELFNENNIENEND